MNLLQAGLTLAGVAVLAFVLYDIFTTVLLHWGGSIPLGPRVLGRLWHAAVALVRGRPAGQRRRILAYFGAAMIPLTVILWAGGVVLGFALLYSPWMPSGYQAGESVPDLRSLVDAIYYSGVTFFTLGYGDITPVSSGLRLLAIAEAGAGFSLITLVISQLTSVYHGYSQQKVTAESVYYLADGSADAAMVITGHLVGAGPVSPLAGELSRLRDGIVTTRSAYTSYPILYYFIAARPEQSLVRLLFVIQDLSVLLDTAVDPDRRPEIAGLGHRCGLARAAREAQDSLASTLLGELPHVDEDELPGAWKTAWKERFESACDVLRRGGVAVRDDHDAVEAYCAGRAGWEPTLRAVTHALGEEWGEITGGY